MIYDSLLCLHIYNCIYITTYIQLYIYNYTSAKTTTYIVRSGFSLVEMAKFKMKMSLLKLSVLKKSLYNFVLCKFDVSAVCPFDVN